jgi:hypothetical protein
LWGPDSDPNVRIAIEAWEPYLVIGGPADDGRC